MKNRWKLALGLSVVCAVGAAVVWIEATPVDPAPSELAPGTLARAVEDHCDGERRGAFTKDDLAAAVTCRDLAAQESMALSTRRLVWLNWLQIFVAVGGAATVIWTVLVALRSMNLTRQLLIHQQKIDRLNLRPTMSIQPLTIKRLNEKEARIAVRLVNIGISSARRMRRSISWKVVDIKDDPACQLDITKLKLPEKSTIVSRNGYAGWQLKISAADLKRIEAGKATLQIGVCAIYDDELGGKYRMQYGQSYRGPELGLTRYLDGFKPNLPEHRGREP